MPSPLPAPAPSLSAVEYTQGSLTKSSTSQLKLKMASQYQQPQGQYYPAPAVPEKGHTMGVPPQNMGFNPNQQQFAYGNGHNTAGYGHVPPPAVYSQPTSGAPASSGARRSSCSCFALMAAILILIAAVIGLSAGLGVSQRNLHNAQADLARAAKS